MSGFGVLIGTLAAVTRVALVLVIAGGGWLLADRWNQQEHVAERRALDTRAFELAGRALVPGSPLACLDANAGEAVEDACEKSVFASPETVATSVAYMSARLSFLADGLAYARRTDAGYESGLSGLRRAVEADRYGIVAHVLATRDGCTAERCDSFVLLRDAAVVKANMNARTYEKNVERHAAAWSEPKAIPPVAALTVPAAPAAPVVATGSKIDFPTASSIPPISIMNEPPAAPPATAEAVPQPRRPAAAPAPARKPATAAAPPAPATNAAAAPRSQ